MRASTSTKSADPPEREPADPVAGPLVQGFRRPSRSAPARHESSRHRPDRIGSKRPVSGDKIAWRSVYTSHEHRGLDTEAFETPTTPDLSRPAVAAIVPVAASDDASVVKPSPLPARATSGTASTMSETACEQHQQR